MKRMKIPVVWCISRLYSSGWTENKHEMFRSGHSFTATPTCSVLVLCYWSVGTYLHVSSCVPSGCRPGQTSYGTGHMHAAYLLQQQRPREVWGFYGGEASSRGLLSCDAVKCCGRVSTFQSSRFRVTSGNVCILPQHYTASQPSRPRIEQITFKGREICRIPNSLSVFLHTLSGNRILKVKSLQMM
jgi:hypothetical protein